MSLFAGHGRDELRRQYLEAWRKYTARLPLSPLEHQIATVIADHPEYVAWLESGADTLNAEFTPEAGRDNPFLHMGLHLAIRDQVATDRPVGIARIHRDLAQRRGSAHEAEHAMLEPLARTLWEAQHDRRPPDEQLYWELLQRLGSSR
jgi:hypothetical protein